MSGTYAGSPIPRVSRRLTSPLWNHYKCGDGKWVMLAMAQPGRYWPPFRKAIEEATGERLEPEEMSIDWIRMHAADLMALIGKLDELFATRPARGWLERFRRHDLLIEVVQDYGELADDPQVLENEMVTTFEHPAHGPLRMVNATVNLERTPGQVRGPAPEFGQHTEEVLLEHGFAWEEIEGLRREGVIGLRQAERGRHKQTLGPEPRQL
ncbi:MAG: CoA transferase [Chloroflexi bacterium]|nr:CoA transferase [Chloroflexota bacterium]